MSVPVVEHDFPRREQSAEELARAVAADLREAIDARDVAVLALSGGTTPALFLRRLGEQELDWSGVIVTLVDERWVPPTHERSNARVVAENLLRGPAALARFAPLYSTAPDPEHGQPQVATLVGGLPLPFDAVVLGLGLDGHTASWFPDGDRLADALDPHGTAPVLPMRAPAAGEPRMTLTLPLLAAARHLYLLIEGVEKQALLKRIVGGDAATSPLRALLENTRTPLQAYWSA
jgi:6-phosphogluconolactonase